MRLIVALYTPKEEPRQVELRKCLAANVARFRDVVVLAEDDDVERVYMRALDREQVRLVELKRRATFADALRLGAFNGTNVLANADVTFDDSIAAAARIGVSEFWCVTRRDVMSKALYSPAMHSQDVWAWQGIYRGELARCEFHFGQWGCDNRIAWEASQAGYALMNPCATVNAWHHHGERRDGDKTRAEGPSMFVPPSVPLASERKRGDWEPANTRSVVRR